MKNKVYLFLLLCCMGNFAIANTSTPTLNEADPSFTVSTETNTSNIEDFFTDPVINCPSNIVRTAQPGQNSMTVSWNVPTATTPCTVSNGSNCPNNNISGFIYMGKLGGSKYYCSDNSNYTYWQAKQKAEQNGGYLAVICNATENQFIRDAMSSVSNPANQAWIGLNDEANEGHFKWVNGTTCGYRNWASGEPNNDHNTNQYHGADNVVLHRSSGKWKDRNGQAKYEFVMEIPCDDGGTRPGNVTVSQVAGPGSGSSFAVGSTTTIRYRATDECGRSKECSFTIKINSGGPVDPCVNQGGDNDGDGVCNNQDNCKDQWNPGQEDNDGDGIGNVCDPTPDGNPCANQGGDNDGDGVCNNLDNCRDTWNPDQADNDGDGIGNVCDPTPDGGGGGDCNDVSVSGEDGKISVSNIPGGAKVEYQGPSTGWGVQVACDGNCGDSKMITGLTAGDYTVTVQTFNPYCYKQYRVKVTGGGGSPCDNQGGDNDGDGVCNNQDNCRDTWNPDQADNDRDGIGNVCDPTPDGNPCDNQGGDNDGDGVCNNQDNCRDQWNPGQEDNDGDGIGNVCDPTPDGNPCANQGGDNDGDGVCNNQDNCKDQWNPGQEDNDGDGIGNVCDPTPDGNPCANQGGDNDGDGVCNNQDNCKDQWNPGQEDNDGDGIGNVCDPTPDGGPTVCADRTASETTQCAQGSNHGVKYGGYIRLERKGDNHYINNYHFRMSNGKFVEKTDGTARFTGTWTNNQRSNIKFDVDIHFSGKVTWEPGKEHACLHPNMNNWYYYTTTSGTLTGKDQMAGAKLNVSRMGPAFQVGVGANVRHNQLTFGASGWLKVDVQNQPHSGYQIRIDKTNDGDGDININLTGNANACMGAGSRNADLTFTAFEAQRQVALQWATNSTYRNDFYVIEKSTDGENFVEMTTVENVVYGTDMEAFTQIDPAPKLGDNYYRVKQVYMDGTHDYTATELINFNIALEALEVYPNPVNEALFINLKQFAGKKAHILLSNQYGQTVRELKIDKLDSAPVRMEIGSIPNGIYLLTIQPGNGLRSVTKKLVVGKMY